jgi:HK97 family phage major capsid protein
MSKLPKYAMKNAKWYVSQAADQLVFQRLARAAGGTTMMEHGSKIVKFYQGYPIVISQVLPADPTADYENVAMILFGDIRKAAKLGTRRDIRIQVLEERYADYDQLGVKATERFDIVVHDLGDGTTAGPVVGLIGN